ncbi:MAG: alpha-amylase, partial [Chloroflexi bacterium]|nr:alpha-amylase [Chloroflexota bacterium]
MRSRKIVYRCLLTVLLLALLPLSPLTRALPTASADEDTGIDTSALLHDSRSDLYRTPGGAVTTETPVTLRFRTAAGNVDSVSVNVENWRAGSQSLLPMTVVTTTPDGYDLWEVTLDTGRQTNIYYYRFLVNKGDQTVYYEDDTRPEDGLGPFVAAREGSTGQVYDTSPNLTYQITVYDAAYYTPDWMRNAVIYQIFPDRFRNGDTSNDPANGSEVFYGELPLFFHNTWNEAPLDGRVDTAPTGAAYYNSDFFGGDIAGIIEKLDYLEALGVTAIYLNPVFEARSNHRYDTSDYLAVDPILGDLDDFEQLVAEAEARGMVIILDAVFNHLSSDSVFFDRYHRFETDGACESTSSPYRDWFFFSAPRGTQPDACVDDGNGNTYYTSWAGYDSIPKIDNSQLEPREYFFLDDNSVGRFWGNLGIGGWRLDVAGDIDPGGPGIIYWEPFRAVVRDVNPETVIIGEEWDDATRWLLGNEWDSVMNYRVRKAILGFAGDEDFYDNDSNGDR